MEAKEYLWSLTLYFWFPPTHKHPEEEISAHLIHIRNKKCFRLVVWALNALVSRRGLIHYRIFHPHGYATWKSNDWDVSYYIDDSWLGIGNQSIFDEEPLSFEDSFNLQKGRQ